MKQSGRFLVYTIFFLGLVIFYLFLRVNYLQNSSGGSEVLNPTNWSVIPVFLTGLVTGGLTCLAVQGGLLASALAAQEEEKIKNKSVKTGSATPIVSFLASKLVAYTAVGGLLGWFGSLFQLSLPAIVITQLAVVVFMLGTAGNILEIHPIFRYFAIQPPKFLTRYLKSQSRSNSVFAPAILGFLTIFIPCGTTQAMMALAIGSGSPLSGALIMFAFTLGTTPLFFVLGFFATKLGDIYQSRFMKIAAFALILMALFNLRNTMSLAGVDINLAARTPDSSLGGDVTQNPVIEFTSDGYQPKIINVKAGSHVSLSLRNRSGSGCIQSFVIPKLNLSKVVPIGDTEKIDFTAPKEKGQIAFMCGMGMYRGVINVI
jgi:sulfite exporter TauE/SafE